MSATKSRPPKKMSQIERIEQASRNRDAIQGNTPAPATGWMFVSYNPNTGRTYAAISTATSGNYTWQISGGPFTPVLFGSPDSIAARNCASQFKRLDKHHIAGFAYIGPPGPVPKA